MLIIAMAIVIAGCGDKTVQPDVPQQHVRYVWVNDEPKWSPSGRYLLYNHYAQTLEEQANGTYQIWSVDLATGATQFRATGSNAQWMDGDAAFTFRNEGLYRFDLASSQQTLVLACGLAAQASPDSRLLALVGSCGSVGSAGPTLFDPATHASHTIDTPDGGCVGSPAWSPDGTRLAVSYIFADGTGFQHVCVLDTSGANFTPVSTIDTRFDDRSATWTRDGNWIYWDRLGVSGYESQTGIWRVHPDGTGAQLVVQDGFYPSFAPGDTAMAFTKFDSLHVFNIWISDMDGGHQRRLFALSDSSATRPAPPPLEAHSAETAYLLRLHR